MIKKLRFKFILVSLFSIFIVLGSTMAAINISNYHSIEKSAKSTLTEVIDKGLDAVPPDESPGPPMKTPGDDDREERGGSFISKQVFLVIFNEDASIDKYDLRRVFSLSEEEGLNFARSIFEGSSESGKNGVYRYKKATKDTQTHVAVIDLKLELEDAKVFLVSSFLIAILGYLAIAALIIGASFIVFKPTQESYKKQKQFITNASHELKTPLTIISTDVEIIEMDNGKSEWTESIKDQVSRLTKMTNQLVTLAKIEELDLKDINFEEFSISELTNEVVETFRPTFDQTNIIQESNIEKELTYKGNKSSIEELLNIFLSNSLKYTPKQGNVSLDLKKNKGHIVITIKNDLTPNHNIDTNQLFDRFYTSSNSEEKGSGIGLSIAKEIIRIHKGEVKAKIGNNQIVFEIIL